MMVEPATDSEPRPREGLRRGVSLPSFSQALHELASESVSGTRAGGGGGPGLRVRLLEPGDSTARAEARRVESDDSESD